MTKDEIARLRELIRLEPANAACRAELGTVLFRQEQYADAESLFRDCVRLEPGNPAYYVLLGRVLSALGRHSDGEAAFGKAVQCEPEDPALQAELGRALSNQGKHAQAEAAFRKTLDIEPNKAFHHAGLGRALAGQGRYEEAEAAFRQAIQSDPGDPGYWDGLGEALGGQGKHAEAERQYREAIKLDADVPSYQVHLGQTLVSQARHDGAEVVFRKAIELVPDSAAAHVGLGHALVGQARHAEAELAFRKAIEFAPGSAAAHAGLGLMLAREARHAEAEVQFRRAVQADPGRPGHRADLGRALAAQGRYAAAEVEFRRAVQADRDNPAYHADLGRALLSQKFLADAERELREAIRLAPADPSYKADLGQDLLSRRRFSEAEKLFREAVYLDRGNQGYRAGLGRTLSVQGKFAEAEKYFSELAQNNRDAAEYRAELGHSFLGRGRYPEAQRLFREAIRLDAKNPAYRVFLGRCLVVEGQHREAQRLFCEAIRLAPDSAAYRADLGRSLSAQGEFAAAGDALLEAVRLARDSPAYNIDLGRALFSQKRYVEATKALQDAVRLDPANAPCQADLGRALRGQGSHTAAEEAFREAVRLDPASPAYTAELGRSLFAQERYAEAEDAFREAVRLDPASPAHTAELGRSLFAQERYAEAEDALSTAVRLDPANPDHQAALGLTYIKRGELTWAENILGELLQLKPAVAGTGAADLQRAVSEAYDDAIVNYACDLAERISDRSDLRRRGVAWREYRDHVPRIAREQLTNIRPAYYAWSEVRFSQGSEHQDIRSLARIHRLKTIGGSCILTVALVVSGLLFADYPPVFSGEARRAAEITSLVVAILGAALRAIGFRQKGQERSKSSRASLMPEDELTALITNLVLEPAVNTALQISWKDSAIDRVGLRDGPELSAKAEMSNLISTDAKSRLAIALSRHHGAAVALAGPRGSGKTELARAFTELRPLEPSSRTIPLMLWAPAKYDAHTFLLRLLKELCISIISAGSESSEEYGRLFRAERRRRLHSRSLIASGLTGVGLAILVARIAEVDISTLTPFVIGSILVLSGVAVFFATHSPRQLRSSADAPIRTPTIERAAALRMRVEFTETYTRGAQLGVSGYGLSASTSEGSQYARVPLNEIDVVRELRTIVKSVAEDGWQVVIAIDELDKMRDADEAMTFLNHVKVLFPIHDCSFIVSVSEDAWARFESRGLPLRDVFDSSFDEVVLVNMLKPLESRDFLKRRSNSITDAQTLFCHCLSGGLPRDLIRAARQLANVADRVQKGQVQKGDGTEPPLLCDVLTILLWEDLNDKLRASGIRARGDRGSGRQSTTAWPGVWRDPDETEQLLADICKVRGRQASAIFSSAASQEPDSEIPPNDYIEAYIAVLHTIRQAFLPGGPLGQLGQERPVSERLLEGFHCIASARGHLASDVDSAWRLIHEARGMLGLTLLGTTVAQSVAAGPSKSAHEPSQSAGRPAGIGADAGSALDE
jgi:Flp pilus assembly protein TadD